MLAVTFQAPGVVAVEERPEPALERDDDVIVAVEATGICGSDLHLYKGRIDLEQGFTLGHEYVGTVLSAGPAVTRVAVGDRVLGCFHTACGTCVYCLRGVYQRCVSARTFGHGAALGSLQGAQAEQVLVPSANLTLRRVPPGISTDAALFAGDVMGTGFHAIHQVGLEAGETCAVLGLGPVGLCAVQVARAAGASRVIAVDTVPDRLALAESFGATAVHLTEGDPRGVVKELTGGLGVVGTVDAVGAPAARDMAVRMTRPAGRVSVIGAYAERCEVHMGIVWLRALTLHTGQANVIGHVDRVLEMMARGQLDPMPLVSRHMPLAAAAEAYAAYDRQEALKIVLTP
jgi:threonine dehydrogenase-like Zn-dependent dehydrogenase